MAIFRVCKDKDNPYVQIKKTTLQDIRLSWKAKGILAYLLSLPDDWQIYEQEITKHSSDGIKSTRSGIKELIASGYIQRIQLREDGKFKGYEYQVYETPTVMPKTENGNCAEVPKTENGKGQNAKGVNGEGHTTNNNLTDNYNTDNNRTEKKEPLSPSAPIDKFLNSIKSEMSDVSFKTWIEPLEIKEAENKITIITPNDFVKGILENKFLDEIKKCAASCYEINDIELLSKDTCEGYINSR